MIYLYLSATVNERFEEFCNFCIIFSKIKTNGELKAVAFKQRFSVSLFLPRRKQTCLHFDSLFNSYYSLRRRHISFRIQQHIWICRGLSSFESLCPLNSYNNNLSFIFYDFHS